MTWFAIVLVLALGFIAAWQGATRLDRLHRKVAATRIALDVQLVRRASAAVELATVGVFDPASAVLVSDAGYMASRTGPVASPETALQMDGLGTERELAESVLSATLREALGAPSEVDKWQSVPSEEQVASLAAAWYRATLARRFHNEAVEQAYRVRMLWHVRLFHLAGRAPIPHTVELDDIPPPGLLPNVG